MHNQDVTILYQGGSGGFLLFYYLLLSQQFNTDIIPPGGSIQQAIDWQFNHDLINKRTQWKSRELWPNNIVFKQSTATSRLFLICNPFFNPEKHTENARVAHDTYKILLYTDIKLQLRLAWDKQAWWFTSVSRKHFNYSTHSDYIRWIHSQGTWDPAIEQIRNHYRPNLQVRLEEFVQTACLPGWPAPNVQQQEFVNYWRSLQSVQAQRLLAR